MNLKLVRGLYNLAVLGTSPGILSYLVWRAVVQKRELSLAQRFGFVQDRPAAPTGRVWCHAVSAGEAAAAAPVLRNLKALRPDLELLVTNTTLAGHEMAEKASPPGTLFQAYPVDWPFCVVPSLRRSRPDAIVLVEMEIWPNFIQAAKRRGVPVLLISGRVSDRGLRRALRFRPWLAWPLGMLDFVGMQSEVDAERAVLLGAPADRVRVLGNTKFDEEAGPLSAQDAEGLRRSLGLEPDAQLLLGGSTRPGEEAALLETHQRLRERHPRLRLALAPRHLQRVGEVLALAESAGYRVVRRSLGPPSAPPDAGTVLLLDTMGELAKLYAAATLAFVGGTFPPIGGHNLLQPIAQGIPVFFGPHTENSRDIAELLLQQGVGFRVRDAADLAVQADRLLASPATLEELRDRSLRTMAANRGASLRYAEEILRVLDRRRQRQGQRNPGPGGELGAPARWR